METTIGGATYQIRKLTPFQQFHVARRLAPALWALGTAAADALRTVKTPDAAVTESARGEAPAHSPVGGMLAAFEPIADVIAKMSDEDSEYILTTCLSVVYLQQNNSWAPILPPNRSGLVFMFDSITLPVMMQLTVEVIKENLGNFFVALPGV